MLKKFFVALGVLAVVGASTSTGWAQCDHPSATTGTYQRFSYAPTSTVAPIVSAAAIPSFQSSFVQAPMAQSYRRFSYQPSTRAQTSRPANKAQWEYSKADPRRQSH